MESIEPRGGDESDGDVRPWTGKSSASSARSLARSLARTPLSTTRSARHDPGDGTASPSMPRSAPAKCAGGALEGHVGHDFHCEVGGVKAPGTPWRKLPSSGPFAISGMRRAPVKQYKFLEREGAKFHLRTRAQMHGKKVAKLRKAAKKEARKIKRKLAKRAVRGREYAPLSTPAADALANALDAQTGSQSSQTKCAAG